MDLNTIGSVAARVPGIVGSGIGGYINEKVGNIGQAVSREWNTPRFLGATPKNMYENIAGLPSDFIRGLPDAKASFGEYARTIGVQDIPLVNFLPEKYIPEPLRQRTVAGQRLPTGIGLAFRASDPFSPMIGEMITPSSNKPLLERTAEGIWEGRNLYTALRQKGVHPALALAAEMMTPSAFNIMAAEKAATRFAGLQSPDVNDIYKAVTLSARDMGMNLNQNQALAIASGFEPKFDQNGNFAGLGYNEGRAALALGITNFALPMAAGFVKGPKAVDFEKPVGTEQVSPYSPDVPYKVISDADAELTGLTHGKAVDVIDHPALFASYPQLADVNIKMDPRTVESKTYTMPGSDVPDEITIGVKGMDPETIRTTVLHELGVHGPGKVEGFQAGGLPQKVMGPYGEMTTMQDWLNYRNKPGEVMAYGSEAVSRLPQSAIDQTDVYARGIPGATEAKVPAPKGDIVDQIMAYESGEMTPDQEVAMMQKMIDDGSVWKLQGSYGRAAMDMLDQGLVTLGPKPSTDAYGNYIPSKTDVKPGTKGSVEYAAKMQADLEGKIPPPSESPKLATNQDVADAFANYREGRSGSMFIGRVAERPAVYSYGEHFPIAVMTSPNEVYFNTDKYSVTTSHHQNLIKNALDPSVKVIETDTNGMQNLIGRLEGGGSVEGKVPAPKVQDTNQINDLIGSLHKQKESVSQLQQQAGGVDVKVYDDIQKGLDKQIDELIKLRNQDWNPLQDATLVYDEKNYPHYINSTTGEELNPMMDRTNVDFLADPQDVLTAKTKYNAAVDKYNQAMADYVGGGGMRASIYQRTPTADIRNLFNKAVELRNAIPAPKNVEGKIPAPTISQAEAQIQKSGGYANIDNAPLAAKNAYASNEIATTLGLNRQFLFENSVKTGTDLVPYLRQIDAAPDIATKVNLGAELVNDLAGSAEGKIPAPASSNLKSIPEAAGKTFYNISKGYNGEWNVDFVKDNNGTGELVRGGSNTGFDNAAQAKAWADKQSFLTGGELPNAYKPTFEANQRIRDLYIDGLMASEGKIPAPNHLPGYPPIRESFDPNYDATGELKKWQAKYGETYMLPDGTQKTMKPAEFAQFMKDNPNLRISQPPLQPSSIEEAMVGIKGKGIPGMGSQNIGTLEGKIPAPLVDKAYKLAVENGGVTINLEGKQPNRGYAYSPYKGAELAVKKSTFTPQVLEKYMTQHETELGQKGNYLGIWRDGAKIYTDISKVGPDTPETIKEAESKGQLAVFDLGKFETIYTKLSPNYETANRTNLNQGENPTASTQGSAEGRVQVPTGYGQGQGYEGKSGIEGKIPNRSGIKIPSISGVLGAAKKIKGIPR